MLCSAQRQKKVKQSPIGLQKLLNWSGRRANKTWVDQGRDFYNRSMKSWLHYNGIEMCSIHNT